MRWLLLQCGAGDTSLLERRARRHSLHRCIDTKKNEHWNSFKCSESIFIGISIFLKIPLDKFRVAPQLIQSTGSQNVSFCRGGRPSYPECQLTRWNGHRREREEQQSKDSNGVDRHALNVLRTVWHDTVWNSRTKMKCIWNTNIYCMMNSLYFSHLAGSFHSEGVTISPAAREAVRSLYRHTNTQKSGRCTTQWCVIVVIAQTMKSISGNIDSTPDGADRPSSQRYSSDEWFCIVCDFTTWHMSEIHVCRGKWIRSMEKLVDFKTHAFPVCLPCTCRSFASTLYWLHHPANNHQFIMHEHELSHTHPHTHAGAHGWLEAGYSFSLVPCCSRLTVNWACAKVINLHTPPAITS